MLGPDELTKLCISLIKNKEQVIRTLYDDINKAEAQVDGLTKVIPSLDQSSEENFRYQLKTCMQVQAQQALIIRKLLMMNFILVASGDLERQAASVANTLGGGKEALQAMFNAKLGGK
jgi:hypothetical protein